MKSKTVFDVNIWISYFILAYQSNSNYLVSGDKKVLDVPVIGQSLKLLSKSAFKIAVGVEE
jgi:predicted nucleic acid-binding protein